MARPFLETFGQMRSGRLMEECAIELEKIVDAVMDTHCPGELTIKIKVKAPKKGGIEYLLVEDSISTKLPKLGHSDTIFFRTRDGGLTRQDPSQQELPLRSVDKAPLSQATPVDNNIGSGG